MLIYKNFFNHKYKYQINFIEIIVVQRLITKGLITIEYGAVIREANIKFLF
jgi:hypothetical protein